MLDRAFQFLIDSLKLLMFWTVVPHYAGGVILRLGNFHRLAGPGFHWMWPFNIETILTTNVVPETMNLHPQSLTTKDGVAVVIGGIVTFGIKDAKTFLLEIENGNSVVEDSAYGIISEHILGHTWEELMNMDIAHELQKDIKRQAKRYGVEIVNFAVADFTRSRSIRLLTTQG
jgi:regulator of protease activity HflC (stomatin/prohibitin superfamily)